MSSFAYKGVLSSAIMLWAVSEAAGSQSLYYVAKGLVGIQGTASGPVPDTYVGPYDYFATAPTSASVTPPGLSPISLTFVSSNDDYELSEYVSTQAAQTAAFPDGNFTMSGGGFPTLSISVTGDLYPNVPEVTNGTWQNGVLLVNPAQSYTLNLNTFTGYNSTGVASDMEIQITSLTSADNVNLVQKYATESFGNGTTVSSTPFTSYTIPANTLQPGLVYELVVNYYTLASVNTTTISGSSIVGAYENTLVAYIGTTSTPAVAGPTIALQPTNQAVGAGTSATFNAAVTFNSSSQIPANTSVNWWFNGVELSTSGSSKYSLGGANNVSLTVNNVGASDVGNYFVQVINAGGAVASTVVTLNLTGGTPTITTQPAAQTTVNAGASPTLSVTASNATSYQWQFNGTAIAGATNSTLALTNIGTTQMGNYTVVVNGVVTSSTAAVTVNVGSSLYNISSRAYLGSGTDQNIVAGFYTNGSGSKRVVLGGIGPDLTTIDPALSGLVLTNPKLTLFNGSATALGINTAWGGSETLVNALASVYAPPLPSGSNDTVIFMSVPAGPGIGYTAEVDSANNGTGIALVEAYDYDAYTGTPASNLINISTRAFVGTGNDVLVAGFWTIGSTSQTVLIRAVGTGLAASDPALNGLTLVTPTLTVYDSSGNVIATNTGWGNAPVRGNSAVAAGLQTATTAIMNSVYASTIAAGSTDCAMVVTLPPNNGYTAQVNGVNSTTGIALVEVYNIPPP